jgi:hypothetical protein
LLIAGVALAGTSTLRLNGAFSLQDQTAGTDNAACLVADFVEFRILGLVEGATDGCNVAIFYDAFAPNKTSASVLKDDNSGNARVAQQVETELSVTISGAECPTAPYEGSVQPEKCKVSSSVEATVGSPDSKGKVSVSCEVGSEGSELVPSPTTAQIDTIVEAFAGRSDVKITDSGKVTIKLKGEDGILCAIL